MNKCRYNINNLDCAHCAKRIEDNLNKRDDLKNVSVNFATSKISFESKKDFSLSELNRIVKEIDSDATITYEEDKKEFLFIPLILGTVIGLMGYFLPLDNTFKIILYIISYGLLLYRVIIKAFKLLKNKIIDENLLISISCLGALLIGEVLEGMMVIILYSIGKILESFAVNNSRRAIKDIINILQSNGVTVVQFLGSNELFNLEYKNELFEHYLFKGV